MSVREERIAMLLEDVSSIARDTNGYAAAAAAMERAAEVSPLGRTRRLYLAAADSQLAGLDGSARRLLHRADAAAKASNTEARYGRCAAAADLERAAGALRTGRSAVAREILAACVDRLRAIGATRAMPEVLSLLAGAELRGGDPAAAQDTAGRALALAALTHDEAEFSAVCTLALASAVRGETERSLAFHRRAIELADRDVSRLSQAAEAQIMLDFGTGCPEQVMRTSDARTAIENVPDVLEATIRAGYRLTTGDIDVLRNLRDTAPRPLAAAAWRVLGLVAEPDRFTACFERSLTLHAGMDLPFDRGRVLLAFGERLRRAGRRVAARTHLNEARLIFVRMGADPWTANTIREIDLTDTAPALVVCRVRRTLTRQEYEVARTVATGATNRQAAAQLFVSVKTVEFHLGNIFRKLDVSNRTQLARRFSLSTDLELIDQR